MASLLATDYHAALDHLKKGNALAPHNAEIALSLSSTYLRLGKPEEAIAAATKSLELFRNICSDSANVRAHHLYQFRGDAYASLKMCGQALSDYDKAVELAPLWPFTHKRCAAAHSQLENYDKALADIAKAVELNPDDVSSLTWIPRAEVAKCPDEAFRKGLLDLADKTIELTHGAERAYAARASLRAAFGVPEEPPTRKEQPGKTESETHHGATEDTAKSPARAIVNSPEAEANSPEGAEVNSQGRKPLEKKAPNPHQP